MKNISIKKISVILILIFLPALSFAEEGGIGDVLATLQELLGSLYLIILALVGIVFAWSLFNFIFKADKDEKGKSKTTLIWSLIAMFLLVSVWGIVHILQESLGIDDHLTPKAPMLPTTPL